MASSDDSTTLAMVREARPVFWANPMLEPDAVSDPALPLHRALIDEAADNWRRMAPLLERLFSELASAGGRIESPLVDGAAMAEAIGLDRREGARLLLKCDHNLPVAGSVKARGGIYEVALHAERLARSAGVLGVGDNLVQLAAPEAKALFARHTVAVGSTGNLGLSVGMAARALGFRAVVHMSADAKPWKVARLRAEGVEVVQHEADYTAAVAAARSEAETDPSIYFVDDERSRHLFLGYSASAFHLRDQLSSLGVLPSEQNPLIAWLPCGIGGAPGGIAFGLKAILGPHVHCVFVEPVQSPCMLVRMASRSLTPVSVRDFGLTNRTEADGMAVAVASDLVVEMMRYMLDGIVTVEDADLFRFMALAQTLLGQKIEPSAASGFSGPALLAASGTALSRRARSATHLVWSTGGRLVPADEHQRNLARRSG